LFKNKFKEYELLAPVIVLILLCVFIGLINNNFFSFRNFIRIANGASIPLIHPNIPPVKRTNITP